MVTNEFHATLYVCMHGCRFSVGAPKSAIEAPSELIMGPKNALVVVHVAQDSGGLPLVPVCATCTTSNAILGPIIGSLGASIAHLWAPTENLQPCMQMYSVAWDSFVTIFMATTTIRNNATEPKTEVPAADCEL